MSRIMKVYTRSGDAGTTTLVGGRRAAKDSLRVAAYGTVDELSSAIGLTLATGTTMDERLAKPLWRIQNELSHLEAELATPPGVKAPAVPRIRAEHVTALEALIDELSVDLPPMTKNSLPGGTAVAAHVNLARTICRRAEREALALAREESVDENALVYLNRLSDALFVMARWENERDGRGEILWDSDA